MRHPKMAALPAAKILATTFATVLMAMAATPLAAQDADWRLRDRGPGIPLSMFGTYIEPGEAILYGFFEYYRDGNAEYSPDELGYPLDRDFRAPSEATEWLVFVAYGVSDRLALEFEAALYTSQWLDKDPDDPTDRPDRIRESGLGDVEGQVRWRWARETDRRPGIFSYFEYVLPLQRDRVLIGTSHWELKFGTGVVRGFRWGTMTAKVAVEYDGEDDKVEAGEYALEYLRRISPAIRLYAAIEGSEDEVELIPEVQWFLTPDLRIKLNSAVGLTSKADDWAPEVGVMVSF